MANLNKVFLMGNLTADPELRYTPKGTAVTDIRLAINRYYAGDNSERQEETTFVDVTLWNRQAEVAGNYLSKGRGVFVEGRLQLDSWEDKASGQKRTKLRVIGENIQLFPRGGEGDMGGAPRQQYQNAPRSNNYGQSRPAQNYNPPPMPPHQSAVQRLRRHGRRNPVLNANTALSFYRPPFLRVRRPFYIIFPERNGCAVPRKEKVVQPHSRQWRKSMGTTGQKGKPHRSFQLGKISPSRHTGGV